MVNAPQQVPRIGMFATVRNRHGVTTGVEPFDGPTGRLHLVHVEYKDDQAPRNEKLIGELEAETGGWLKGVASSLQAEIAGLDATVAGLRLNQATGDMTEVDPLADSRYAELEGLIERLLRAKGDWLDDERLVVFTEYQTTLDYVVRRLTATFGDDRVLTLFGGMDDVSRGDVKEWFNHPAHQVRLLVATDAAAEGLNLQRNGRIDRHGQPHDVTIFHFVTDQDQDLAPPKRSSTKQRTEATSMPARCAIRWSPPWPCGAVARSPSAPRRCAPASSSTRRCPAGVT